jgi:DNA (cytosine-5)-methyltransferase 1
MGTGGHNVPLILDDYGIRKLTPRECFTLQGFPDSYVLPKGMSNGRLYKQAGNSVTVTVIQRIAENILNVLNNT